MASRNAWRRKPSADVTAGARSRRRSWLPPGPQPRRRQVIVLGMTRSGTSLTTAIVAGLLGGSTRPAATWCGSARPYPKDRRTTAAGYFERQASPLPAAPHSPSRTLLAPRLPRMWSRSTIGCSRSWVILGPSSPPASHHGQRYSPGVRRTRVQPAAASSSGPPVSWTTCRAMHPEPPARGCSRMRASRVRCRSGGRCCRSRCASSRTATQPRSLLLHAG